MKVLIVDDERMPAQHLEELIRLHCFEVSSIDLVFSPIEALEHLEENEYDILFVDVEMPEVDGLELVKRIALPPKSNVIFVTAYSQYAIEAFKADAIHYIVKPVEEEELIKAIRKVQKYTAKTNRFEDEKNTLSVFDGEEYHIIQCDQIIRLEADGGYTKIIVEDKEHFSSRRLGFYEGMLSAEKFVRCHNSHIVNAKKVKKVGKSNGGYVVMSNGDIVPTSSSKRQLLDLLG